MKKIEAIIRHSRLNAVRSAILPLGVHGMTVSEVKGIGNQPVHTEVYRGAEVVVDLVPKLKLEILLEKEAVPAIVAAILESARTGSVGDGKISVYTLDDVVSIRTGDTGRAAL